MTTSEMISMARSIAARYKRRCWWASTDDMRQEALAAMLQAHRTYLDHPEGDERGYLWKSGVYRVSELVLRTSSPVSASKGALDELKGVHRASLSCAAASGGVTVVRTAEGGEMAIRASPLTSGEAAADGALSDHGWLKRVRGRMDALLGPVKDSHLAREVMLDYLTPRQAAEEARVKVRAVYLAVRRAKRAIENDRTLYDLIRERVEE